MKIFTGMPLNVFCHLDYNHLSSNKVGMFRNVIGINYGFNMKKMTKCYRLLIFLQRAFQCIVIIFEAFELQEVFGPLAALAGGRQVCDLHGGGRRANGRSSQVLGC